MGDGYYMNSRRSMKADRQKDHRRMMARYASLERQFHPSKIGQGKLIELNKKVIGLIDEAIAAEEGKPPTPDATITSTVERYRKALEECAAPWLGAVAPTTEGCYEIMMDQFKRRTEIARRALAAFSAKQIIHQVCVS